MQHTHQVYVERLLFGEAWFSTLYSYSPFCPLAGSFWSRRASLVLLSLLVFPRPVFLWPLFPLIQFLAKVFRLRSLTVLAVYPRSLSYPLQRVLHRIAGDCPWCSTCGR